MRSPRLSKGTLLAITCLAVVGVASIASQASATTVTGGTLNLTVTANAIGDFQNLLTGPVAQLLSVLAIIGGVIAVIQGGGLDNGTTSKVGVVVIALGLLAGVSSWYKQSSEGVMSPADIAVVSSPLAATHAAVHEHDRNAHL